MKEKCINILSELIHKKHILFTKRGNASIKLALKLAKHLGKETVAIPDQGGWISYQHYPDELGLETIELKTDNGIIKSAEADPKAAYLINSMPGYITYQDMGIFPNDIFLINDVSGSIGTKGATIGDIILGSFGRWKPLDLKKGGFIATDNDDYFKYLEDNSDEAVLDYAVLSEKLNRLNKRLATFYYANKQIKHDLDGFDMLCPDKKGINVVVRFSNEEEKGLIMDYCEKHKYEFTLCPRYIRINDNAISIEVKRL